MKLKVVSASNIETGTKDLPIQFFEDVRPDLIKRAVLALQSNERQAYGTDPMAGKRYSIQLYKRRHHYRTSYGHGISRIPRKIMTRRGTRMNWVGAFAPGTRGGRRAHPPKAGKIWEQKINKQERRKAIRSAMAATVSKLIVEHRGHKVPNNYPFIIDSRVQELKKTKDVISVLLKLGFKNELERISESQIRAGRGKSRGRAHRIKTGPLIVVSAPCALLRSAVNIPGVDVVEVQNINAELLAPGTVPGRMTLWTTDAIDRLAKEKLFTNDYIGPTKEKKEIIVKKEVKLVQKIKKPVQKVAKK